MAFSDDEREYHFAAQDLRDNRVVLVDSLDDKFVATAVRFSQAERRADKSVDQFVRFLADERSKVAERKDLQHIGTATAVVAQPLSSEIDPRDAAVIKRIARQYRDAATALTGQFAAFVAKIEGAQADKEYNTAALELRDNRTRVLSSIEDKQLAAGHLRSYLSDMLFLVDTAVEQRKGVRDEHSKAAKGLQISEPYQQADRLIDAFDLFLGFEKKKVTDRAEFAETGSGGSIISPPAGSRINRDEIPVLRQASEQFGLAAGKATSHFLTFAGMFRDAQISLPVTPFEYIREIMKGPESFITTAEKMRPQERRARARNLSPGLNLFEG